MAGELKHLVRMRGSVKQKLTNLEKYIRSIKTLNVDERPPLAEIEIRLKSSENLLKEFDEYQLKIEVLCDDKSLNSHYLEREEFESKFAVVVGFLSNYIRENQVILGECVTSTSVMPHSDPLQGVIVPKIKLPVFKGNYDHWLEFKTTFNSTINSNVALSNLQKFQLLRASVEGYAKRLIDQIEFIEGNYETAWSRLCKRFDNKRILINNHIKSICNLESMHKESSKDFRQLLDNLSNHLAALDGLHLSSHVLWEVIITYLISSKLDKTTYREWKDFKGQGELPTLDEFMEFLTNKADLLEVIQEKSYDNQSQHSKYNFKLSGNKNYSQNHLSFNLKCNYCKAPHLIYNCPQFLKLDIPTRIQKVHKLNLCKNCLRTNHSTDKCTLGPCKKCKECHNSLLHENKVHNTSDRGSVVVSENIIEESPTTSTNLLVRPESNTQSTVLLSTVVFKVKDVQGNIHMCRGLLDSGAQSNLVTEKFCKKLGLPLKTANLSIVGINQVISNLTKRCQLTILSRCSNFNTTMSCYVIPTISNEVPSITIDIPSWKIPENIKLSDPHFHEPREVDVLIGASLFWDLLLDGKITLGKGFPVLQNTKLGWVVSGLAPIQSNVSICNFSKKVLPEDEQLKRFWELEEVSPNESIMSHDELKCEEFFDSTTSRNKDGKFVVKFPLKYSTDLLGDSHDTAIKRFFHLEKRFANNQQLKCRYTEFIREYIRLGHMSKLTVNSSDYSGASYYLPHHGVLKENSLTTKLRVVFDGSCPSTSGWSLNDLQFTGPKLQNDIISILLRFRTYAYVVSSDITKMYRQVEMHPDHRFLQRIIWRDDPSSEFSVYQLNTVTYGTTAAPYLAIKCLQTLALNAENQYSEASKTIINDFYVDDLLTGSDDVTELVDRCRQICSILKQGQFQLRKWISNKPEILSEIHTNHDPLGILTLGEHESSNTLGIKWISYQDILSYDISLSTIHAVPSKRQILSEISQIYDPLGLVSPCIIIAKIIIQNLWSLKLSWDEPIPPDLYSKWNQFRSQLVQLNSIQIPRNTIGIGFELLDIHCFCDASKDAYASCIYLRSRDKLGNYRIRLLCSKTKVSPLKSVSIPRLELCAALLAAQLAHQVRTSLSTKVPFFFWSDSQVVLHWIATPTNKREIFVANRVSKIQVLTKNDIWNYVHTNQNPADIASRGTFPSKLLGSQIWWDGPAFLYRSDSLWPCPLTQSPSVTQCSSSLKFNKENVLTVQITSWDIFKRYSDLNKLKRVFTYCRRFIHNCKTKSNERRIGLLTSQEIDIAYLTLIKIAQFQCFEEELSILSKGNLLQKNHRLSSLSPFLDSDGVLRVGGRLKFSRLNNDVRRPILLSSKHELTTLIFRHKHIYLLHPGPQLLLAAVRQKYWPVGGKILAKKIVKTCITCFKFKPIPASVSMGPLPDSRLTPTLPFQNVGIDYAGPFSLKDKKGRGNKIVKCWVCIFVCFVSKAIHMELVTDLTSECFLSCLNRFISRRGLPSHIYSDNGSTFRGAHNELQTLGKFLYSNQYTIQKHATNLNIMWHFTPPYSPNFGGLWEASVKRLKHHLKRTLLDTVLIYEEFYTILCQVEGILNSRPMFAMSSDPNDLEPITPSHFLIGRPITSTPYTDYTEVPDNRLTRWQHVHKLQQVFWRRFSREYITQLHQSYKWKTESPRALQPGTLVLIKGENQPPYQWHKGRIQKLFPGKDGISRVASIISSKGLIKRSVRHLYPLPLEDDVVQ